MNQSHLTTLFGFSGTLLAAWVAAAPAGVDAEAGGSSIGGSYCSNAPDTCSDSACGTYQSGAGGATADVCGGGSGCTYMAVEQCL